MNTRNGNNSPGNSFRRRWGGDVKGRGIPYMRNLSVIGGLSAVLLFSCLKEKRFSGNYQASLKYKLPLKILLINTKKIKGKEIGLFTGFYSAWVPASEIFGFGV